MIADLVVGVETGIYSENSFKHANGVFPIEEAPVHVHDFEILHFPLGHFEFI